MYQSTYRFDFGRNWKGFSRKLDRNRVEKAVLSLSELLDVVDMAGKRFLDIGCGSGLVSLAARELGAEVLSFDYDQESVECTQHLKECYRKDDPRWVIVQGDILQREFVESLGLFDVVYAWGVLHHTGDMWRAVENALSRTASTGIIVIALYNDQGWKSMVWRAIKTTYVSSNRFVKGILLGACMIRLWGPTSIKDLLKGRPGYTWRSYSNERGMSPWFDVVDWVGGYPFEVTSVDRLERELERKGYYVVKKKTVGSGHGCNEFVFKRRDRLV